MPVTLLFMKLLQSQLVNNNRTCKCSKLIGNACNIFLVTYNVFWAWHKSLGLLCLAFYSSLKFHAAVEALGLLFHGNMPHVTYSLHVGVFILVIWLLSLALGGFPFCLWWDLLRLRWWFIWGQTCARLLRITTCRWWWVFSLFRDWSCWGRLLLWNDLWRTYGHAIRVNSVPCP